MREGAVGFGHPVRIFTLLDSGAAVVGGIDRRAAIVCSLRLRAAEINQRIASACERSGRTSTGT
jgi:hypothetical protein